MTSKRAAVFRHVLFEDSGTLGGVLAENQYDVTYVDVGYDDPERELVRNADLVVILGGPIGVYQVDEYPGLHVEIEITRERLKNGKPTLGICLGSQIMAAALGARVYPGDAGKEIGWKSLTLTPSLQTNPLRVFEECPVLHWHGDTFEMPEGATHLASTDQYENQAFSYGDSALALQFHIETDGRSLERWFIGHAVEVGGVAGLGVCELREQAAIYAETLSCRSKLFFSDWLQSLLR